MAATLKIVFLVVLAFGFLFLPEVQGFSCFECPAILLGEKCSTQRECLPGVNNCVKFHTNGAPKKDVQGHICGDGESGKDICGEVKDPKGTSAKVVTCFCSTPLCNSVGHLHGWTFVQLVAISLIAFIVGGGVKP